MSSFLLTWILLMFVIKTWAGAVTLVAITVIWGSTAYYRMNDEKYESDTESMFGVRNKT